MKRLRFVDWARGVAVLAMILWHTADAWLRPGLQAGEGFLLVRFVGGLAAPTFLLLAGLSSALSAKPADGPEQARTRLVSSLARAAGIVLAGYALRLQTWLVDAAALLNLRAARAWLPIAAGYALLFFALRKLSTQKARALGLLCAGAPLVVLGMLQVESVAAGRLPRLLQVDVLQAIGASLALLALLDRVFQAYRRPTLLLALALLIPGVTSFVWAALPGPLPVGVAAYFGKFAIAVPGVQPSLFPLLPWFAYACAGAACGRWWLGANARLEPRVLACAVFGAALACASGEAQPFVGALLHEHPHAIPLLRVAYRCGLVLVLLGMGYAFESGRLSALLALYGRASLRIYWAHMFFAYGILGMPLRNRLGYLEWLLGVLLVAALMARLARLEREPVRT